jgi:hypothetical protein
MVNSNRLAKSDHSLYTVLGGPHMSYSLYLLPPFSYTPRLRPAGRPASAPAGRAAYALAGRPANSGRPPCPRPGSPPPPALVHRPARSSSAAQRWRDVSSMAQPRTRTARSRFGPRCHRIRSIWPCRHHGLARRRGFGPVVADLSRSPRSLVTRLLPLCW